MSSGHGFSRRQLLGGAAASALLLACSKSGSRDTRSRDRASQRPAQGGTLLFAFDGAAITQFVLDPHNSLFAPHHRIMRSIFDSLVVALPGHRFGPWLAEAWEVSADGLRYTFRLRQDVTFHDGTRFDAEAVKINLDRAGDPKNALYAQIDLGPYKATRVIDAFTVEVALETPFAALLANLSKSSLGMISPAAIQKYGAALGSHPVGTGPFRFESMTPGSEVSLVRNADYRWTPEGARHSGPARLERLTFRNVPEESTRVAVLQSGQAGAADLIPPQNLVVLKRAPDFRLVEGELLNHNYSLHLNTERAPWDDARLRRAFRLSVDLDAAVQSIYLGTAPRAWSPLSPSLFGYDRTLERSWTPDPAQAARTLDELGWKVGPDGIREKAGRRLSMVFLDTQGNREKRLDLLMVLRRQLQKNGIEVKVESQPSGVYTERVRTGNWDLLGASQFTADPDVMRRIYSPELRARTSPSRANDPELTELLSRAFQESDLDKRAALYERAQRLVVERDFAIPVYVLNYTVATAPSVRDIGIDVNGFPSFREAWIAT